MKGPVRPWHHLADTHTAAPTGGRPSPPLHSYPQSEQNLSQPFAVPVIKIEQAFGRVHSEERRHVLVVGEGGAQADEPHVLLRHLDVADGSGYQRLQDGPSVIVQQVDLILKGGNDKSSTPAPDWLYFFPFLADLLAWAEAGSSPQPKIKSRAKHQRHFQLPPRAEEPRARGFAVLTRMTSRTSWV